MPPAQQQEAATPHEDKLQQKLDLFKAIKEKEAAARQK